MLTLEEHEKKLKRKHKTGSLRGHSATSMLVGADIRPVAKSYPEQDGGVFVKEGDA